ncbi:hypothetical protein ACO2Q9_02940 [Variovorax sp. VNK109]|uniref:hypothetical protein n=1 Tax=Variovorax sp. VNK109 TaxID=3400919 RepID=UPI003C1202ED
MSLLDLLLWQFVYLPLALLLAYPGVIQFERGGWWRLLLPFYLAALLVDVWLNFTTLALYTRDVPQRREYTFSQRLQRLVLLTNWLGMLARVLARYLNRWDPTPPHVRLPEEVPT